MLYKIHNPYLIVGKPEDKKSSGDATSTDKYASCGMTKRVSKKATPKDDQNIQPFVLKKVIPGTKDINV